MPNVLTTDTELPWLKKLRAELVSRAAALAPPYGAFVKMRMVYWFRDHDERIAAYQSKLANARKPRATSTSKVNLTTKAHGRRQTKPVPHSKTKK